MKVSKSDSGLLDIKTSRVWNLVFVSLSVMDLSSRSRSKSRFFDSGIDFRRKGISFRKNIIYSTS